MLRFLFIVAFLLQFSFKVQAGGGYIHCDKAACNLMFSTNAGWDQQVVVAGPNGWNISRAGRGEGRIHLNIEVPYGPYFIRMMHNNGSGWRESAVRIVARNLIRADDGGNGTSGINDHDYNDAIVGLF